MILKLSKDKKLTFYRKNPIYIGEKDFDTIEVLIPFIVDDNETNNLNFILHLVNKNGEYLHINLDKKIKEDIVVGSTKISSTITNEAQNFFLYLELIKENNEIIGKTNCVEITIEPLPDENTRIIPKEEYEEIIDELTEIIQENTEAMNRINEFEDGKSAYEIAVEQGYEGTEEEWLSDMKDYSELNNKPKINGKTISSDKQASYYGLIDNEHGYTKAETEQLITHSASLKESLSNKVQSIGSQSQTGDNVNYPSVTAARNYVNTKTDDLQDYIENELDELDEAKADKAETLAGYGINDAYTKAEVTALNSAKADKADYTSVKDFGAKGDGITNDTAAFNTAIAAKRFIFIPAGTYLIDDITVDKSVSIKGAGTAATYLKANSETSGGSLITIIKNRSSISDMSIHGRNGSNVNHAAITVAPHAGTEPNSIAATTTVTLENLKIQGMAGIGINILDHVEDCVISNVDIESCKSSGMKLWGVGHSISNVTSQKNKGDGIEIRQGGLHMTNVRCWGNEGNGMSMGGVSHAVISNVELQQNQLNGLYMVPVDNSGRRNRMNSIINVTTLGNNYKKVGENDEPGSALTENACGFVVSGLYNYVQGFDVLSKFNSGWMACEKYSLLMSQPDDIGNTVDIKTAAGNGIDMYNVMFDSKYSSRIFEEPLKAKIAFNNPFNKIIVDGSAVEPPAMTASVHQSESDVVHSNVSASVTNNGKSITLSGLTSAGVTVVDFNNFYNHSFPYRQIHKINYTSGTKRVYIRLRARVSDFRKFGIVPGVGQIIKQNGTNIGTTYRLGSEDLKKNCIFNTDFTTKEYYFEIPDTTVSLGSFLVMLHFVKLTNDEIDEASFEIDELSAAFLDETPTVIGDKGSNDWGLTEQELDGIADRVIARIPTTGGVLYGN